MLNSQIFGTPSSEHLWKLESEWRRKRASQIAEESTNQRLRREFVIDTDVDLKHIRDDDMRVQFKNDLITAIQDAIETHSFVELIKVQKDFDIGYANSQSWAYRCAKTYNIRILAPTP